MRRGARQKAHRLRVCQLVKHGHVHRGEYDDGLPEGILAFASLGWFLLEVFTMLANYKRLAFHDLIAKTVVVNLEVEGF